MLCGVKNPYFQNDEKRLIMKKTIPFISPLVYGLFGGLFGSCAIMCMSTTFTIYSDYAPKIPFLIFMLIAVLSAILITVMIFINTLYLSGMDDKRRKKMIIVAELLVSIVLLFICWAFWHPILGELLDRLTEIYRLPPKVYA